MSSCFYGKPCKLNCRHVVPQFDFGYDKGNLVVVRTGDIDVRKYVHSFASSCPPVREIVSLYSRGADVSSFFRPATYGDVVGMPTTPGEALKVSEKVSEAVSNINNSLGVTKTISELASMSDDDVSKMILDAVMAKVKAKSSESSEGKDE